MRNISNHATSMNPQLNLLPDQRVRFSESVLALAGWLRQYLSQPRSLDELWAIVDREDSGWHSRPTFTSLVLAVDMLFAIGQIASLGDDDRIRLRTP